MSGRAGRGTGGGAGKGPGKRGSGKTGNGKSPGAGQTKSGDLAGRRELGVRVRTAKGRKLSSTRWLERQLNDPYVTAAKDQGFRSRAAFKLVQLDEKFGLLRKGMRVVDLGAAPGGWSQVAVKKVGPSGTVVAIDINPMEPLAEVTVLQGDMREEEGMDALRVALDGPADLVLSDMAAPATGHAPTDHLRIIALCETAFASAEELLAPGGAFVAKVLQGGTEQSLLTMLKRHFSSVRHAKPPASRSDSSEQYVVAMGFRKPDAGG